MTISVYNASVLYGYTAARSGSVGAVPAEPPASEGRPQHRVQRGQAQEHQAQQKGEVIGHAEQRIADGARPLRARAEVVQRQGHTEQEQGAVPKQGVVVEPEGLLAVVPGEEGEEQGREQEGGQDGHVEHGPTNVAPARPRHLVDRRTVGEGHSPSLPFQRPGDHGSLRRTHR